jgi:hypothetical protein
MTLFYYPGRLVYLAGIVAFVGGERTATLVDNRWFVATIAFGWLAIITVANVRGMGVGKWINNAGGIGSAATVVLLVVAATVARRQGVAATPPMVAGSALDMASGLGVMCSPSSASSWRRRWPMIRNPGATFPRDLHHRGHRHRVVPAGGRRAGAGADRRARRDSGRARAVSRGAAAAGWAGFVRPSPW